VHTSLNCFLSLLLCFIALPFATHAGDQPFSLREALGKYISVVEQPDRVETARLKPVAAVESQEHALANNHRIAGYPVISKPVVLEQSKSTQIAGLLLDKDNYADVTVRCLNRALSGMRFYQGWQMVEVAFGLPCRQVIVVFRDGEDTKWWGGVLGEKAAHALISLLAIR